MDKQCTKCNQVKPETEFFWKQKGIRRSSYCKNCYKQLRKKTYKQHYEKNRTKYIKRAKSNRHKYLLYVQRQLLQLFKHNPCAQCGETNPLVLDFHHIDPNTKVGNISEIISSRKSWYIIEKEINKCICLCANCHRKVTAKEQNTHRYQVCVAERQGT